MQKVFDQLLELFGWIYEIFLYSLVFPLLLSLSIALLTPLVTIQEWLLDQVLIYVPICIISGFLLKNWRNKDQNKTK